LVCGACTPIQNYLVEPKYFDSFIQQHDKNYFTFTLQVHNDSQVRVHSDYHDVRDCIEEVITSFAQHAEQKHHLVLKHHPMDRGYRHYGQLIQDLSRKFGVENRVHYFCDVHLPTLLKHSLGLVTINSTTGIQALYHHVPVKNTWTIHL
jgi:capsular polysaccharide export protein